MAILVTGVVAFSLASSMWWWFCGMVSAASVLYLAYLRSTSDADRRAAAAPRAQRMMRSRHGVENTQDEDFDVVPSRLQRPGAAVLDIDDEDPIFEHLEYPRMSRDYDLPRASGQ